MTIASDTGKGEQSRIRELIIADPRLVLDDVEVLQALASVQNDGLGDNVIDGRGMAIRRLEQKLRQLGAENRLLKEVLHDNSEAVHRIHLAALTLLEIKDFKLLADFLAGELPKVMKVETIRLLLMGSLKGRIHDSLAEFAVGRIDASVRRAYIDPVEGKPEKVVLRQVPRASAKVYGAAGKPIRSEALLPIALDGAELAGVLVVGSSNPDSFHPNMSTDLLELISKVFAMTVVRLSQ